MESYRAATYLQRAYLYFSREGDFGQPPYTPAQLEQMAFDPDRVTELVGLLPTESWRRGDPTPYRQGPPRNFAAWKFGVPPLETPNSEKVVTRLLDAVEPYTDRLRHACNALGLSTGVMVVIKSTSHHADGDDPVPSAAAVAYSSRTIQRLAALGARLDHDQFFDIG
ncbi:DUF4279 domain-containing protein [Cryptosporangium phraense]|uniref:DUF4279 domain-containing protein n=1 Tax=Cryptosporangium phraense TaxID=2593070 RepID=A0A545ADT1_9ACTN|nr:DUF4279 domain-containing protein [Cryptosporangium phraense]TQS39496.1 DUF4279 domain-containing protein [Cryptosporangium phraense]